MKLVPIVFILIFITVFITFFPNIFGGFETQHNMTVSNYTDEYEAVTGLTQMDMVILAAIGTLMVIPMLYIIVRMFVR